MDASNFLSPEALICLPLAILLDSVGIILIIFGLDDFFITDIVGWSTLGVWSAFRSQIRGSGSAEMPQGEKTQAIRNIKNAKIAAEAAEKKAAEEAAKEAAKQTAKDAGKEAGKTASKAAKSAKWIRFLEFVPYLGALPFWTISTFLILNEEEK